MFENLIACGSVLFISGLGLFIVFLMAKDGLKK